MSEKETEPVAHTQGLVCPECGKDIMLLRGRVEAITLKEFRKRVQLWLKRDRAARKAKT